MLFGAEKSHLLMKELRNNGRVVVGFQSGSNFMAAHEVSCIAF